MRSVSINWFCTHAYARTRYSILSGAMEGHFAIATGSLRSFSEQQLMDCSTGYGNKGCSGGLMDNAFKYVVENKGIDDESDYPYVSAGGEDPKTCDPDR